MRRALTLIEMLAVVAILSLVATVSLASLSAAGDGFAATQAGLRDLDATARLYARRHEPVRLDVTAEGIVVCPVAGDTPITAFAWPASMIVEIRHDDPDEPLIIDRRGCSADYDVRVADAAGHRAAWTVLGMTGATVATESLR